MNEILLNILSVLVSAIVLPLISLIGAKLISWLSSKTKSEKATAIIKEANDIVMNAVKCVLQTYVDSLKKEGKFDEASQFLALSKAKEKAMEQMSDDTKAFVEKNYGNLDSWLTTSIEATISTIKNK